MSNLFGSISLHLFDGSGGGASGGASAGTATGGDGTTGSTAGSPPAFTGRNTKSNPLANVQYGKQDSDTVASPESQQQDQTQDRAKAYADFIKEYKDEYDKDVQSKIQNRLRNAKQTEANFNKLSEARALLAKKYGVDPTDIDGLNNAILNDDSFFEDEAIENGITTEEQKSRYRFEQEKKQLDAERAEIEQQKAFEEQFQKWQTEANEMQKMYPNFNLQEELNNESFVNDLMRGDSMQKAYRSAHFDELMSSGLQTTAKKAEEKVANRFRSNQSRPVENGMSTGSSSVIKSDVKQLTKADRAEIARRVARGEKIVF